MSVTNAGKAGSAHRFMHKVECLHKHFVATHKNAYNEQQERNVQQETQLGLVLR